MRRDFIGNEGQALRQRELLGRLRNNPKDGRTAEYIDFDSESSNIASRIASYVQNSRTTLYTTQYQTATILALSRAGTAMYTYFTPRILSLYRLSLTMGRPKAQYTIPPWSARRNMSNKLASVGDNTKVEDEKWTTIDEEPHMFPVKMSDGYYPLSLGETLRINNEGPNMTSGRFEIVRKLGWGGSSSVWLAESQGCVYGGSTDVVTYTNIRCKDVDTRYQAVKVLTVGATASTFAGILPEIDSLTTVTSKNPEHPGYRHCTSFLGKMLAWSKSGPHFCFIFEPMGNLWALRRPNGAFPLLVTKKIIKQTLLALDYIHTDCGLVHTDLKLDNIFVSLGKDPGDNIDEQIHAYLQANPSETYEPRVNSKLSPEPIVTVKSQPLPNLGLNPDLSNLRIKLGDFGVALQLTPENLFIGRKVQPDVMRAPEIVLGHAWSTPIDIWTLGCMVFQCLVTTNIFQNKLDSDDPAHSYVHIFRITQLIGPFPQEFLARCTMRADYFDENGDLLHTRGAPSKTIEVCLDNYKCLKTEELGPAADFIRRCLTIDPPARPTAKELLKDEWLMDV